MKSILTKKYDLQEVDRIANGWEIQNGNQVYMDVELICSTTCGNLNSYSRNIDDEWVRDYMKSLKSDFKRTEERV